MSQTPSPNTTEVTGWNLSTLKEYLELQIKALANDTDLKFKAVDEARKHQYAIDQDHFASLNHEAARILKATEITVSRDVWDGFQENFQEWKSTTDAKIMANLPRTEFQNYKESTDRALTLKAGQAQGFDTIRAGLTFAAGLVVAAVAFWAATKGLR